MSRDRRRHVRAPLLAHVMLFQGDRCLGTFAVLNLSAGGVLLAGQPPDRAGGKLTVILELPGARPLRAEALPVRDRGQDWPPPLTAEDQPAFALAFTRISASGQDALQAAVLTTLEEARAATVLIATPATGHGLALKRDLERSARPAFCVNRIAEAAGFFELRNAVSIALVDEAFATTPEAPLLKHLAEQHPRVLRVLISSQDSTMHPLAEEVFAMPWTTDDVRRLLRLRGRSGEPHAEAGAPGSN